MARRPVQVVVAQKAAPKVVEVVRGRPGRPGAPGFSASASGVVTTPNLVWLLQHNLDIPENRFMPPAFYFENASGEEIEPARVEWATPNAALAIWGDVAGQEEAGSWKV